MPGSLAGLRALDLSDEKGYFCGKILGDLGTDVIKVETPGGDPGRMTGPFYENESHPEKSIFWLAQNTSKRSITLNIEMAEGKAIFHKLLERSDFIIQSFPPGYLQDLGLSHEQVSRINPRLISVSITPFGKKGPYRNFKTSDLVSMAMGGLMFITGYPDRPPVRIGIPQAYLLASAHAAAGALIANYLRRKAGIGQEVDVSIHEAVTRTLFMEPVFWDIENTLIRREGHFIKRAKLKQRELWECKDGQTFFRIFGGPFGRRNKGLVDWIRKEEGSAGGLDNVNWDSLDMSRVSQDASDKWEEEIGKFLKKHHREEIETVALDGKITALFPCYSCKEIASDKHLSQREYWVDMDYPHLGTSLRHPGAFCKMSRTPLEIRRAPRIGEHNREIYMGELGLSKEEYFTLSQAGVL